LSFPQLGPGSDEQQSAPSPSKPDWFNPAFDFEGFSLEPAIDRIIQVALQRAGGNVSAAARLLGVPRDYIRYRLYGPRTKKQSGPEGGQ
jgi:DNA-binding NtrC family response regulator